MQHEVYLLRIPSILLFSIPQSHYHFYSILSRASFSCSCLSLSFPSQKPKFDFFLSHLSVGYIVWLNYTSHPNLPFVFLPAKKHPASCLFPLPSASCPFLIPNSPSFFVLLYHSSTTWRRFISECLMDGLVTTVCTPNCGVLLTLGTEPRLVYHVIVSLNFQRTEGGCHN